MHVPGHLRDRVDELAARLREGEAVEREFLAALRRVWHSTDQVQKDVLDDLASYVEEHLEVLDPEEAEDLVGRLRESQTYASLARTLVPLLRRVVEEEGAGYKALQVRLPEDLHADLDTLAFARRESINSLIIEAVRCLLEANPVPEGLVRRGQLMGKPLRCCPEE
jgi:predicted transcriptional regulator